ncbi:YaeQ family protein [Gilvimarinus agarilyticus]|uniref:YaeQ family protein n=1 Tax=unclassified Gilvimarinus TaxID=2642066 RepID=UPI001C097A6C|nr:MULTISPECIES: YaeQ family protein [unclassified Gilvimarinus]MBU2886012.1 YaeQ family protein [Gilvimarinus agarilyticus]MDO6570758.1 YaeQ family protein [Gilvimarinus sp. 2_MG-2023]MDO6747649.1 YaeQ family protein [Gilvimarinus sp. 1_MG-2023]
MALTATVYKVDLNLSDMDRQVYLDTKLTLACHPSETEERMMVRLLAWCFHANEDLIFGKGLSTVDEPDLWHVAPSGVIEKWIEVGQPSVDKLKKGRSRSTRQVIYSAGRGRDQWWHSVQEALGAFTDLSVYHLSAGEVAELAALAQKNMTLSVCISEGSAFISSAEHSVNITPLTDIG